MGHKHESHEHQCCLIVGTPVYGFQTIGPFPDGATAMKWAEENTVGPDWWISKLLLSKGELAKVAA